MRANLLLVVLAGCVSKPVEVDSDSSVPVSDTDEGTTDTQDTDIIDMDTGSVETDVPDPCAYEVLVLDGSGYHTVTMRNTLLIELDPDSPSDPSVPEVGEKLRVRFTAVDPECGDLYVDRFFLDVNGTDNAGTGWRTYLMYWLVGVYDMTHGDMTTPAMSLMMTGTWLPPDGSVHQEYGFTGHVLVEAGQTTIVAFTASSTSSSAEMDDTFQVSLPATSIIVSDGVTSGLIEHPEIAGNILHY